MSQFLSTEVASLRAFRRALRALEHEIGLSLDRETSCCGVTSAQCHFLLETDERTNLSLSDLSEALALDPSTLSRTSDALVEAGFIYRNTDPGNRRKVSISLTGGGKAKVESINELCDESVRRLFSYIPAEKHGIVSESVVLLADAMTRRRKEEGSSCCSFPFRRRGKGEE